MALFDDLRALLDQGDPNGELTLYYQPQVRMRRRHRRLRRGALYGGGIPIAGCSRRGVSGRRGDQWAEIPLTYRCCGCRRIGQAAQWHAESRPLSVAVNVFPNCLVDDAFVGRVRSVLAHHRLPPALLRLEVTESGMTTDPDRALAVCCATPGDESRFRSTTTGPAFSSLEPTQALDCRRTEDRSDVSSGPGHESPETPSWCAVPSILLTISAYS